VEESTFPTWDSLKETFWRDSERVNPACDRTPK
jgi:hypothetical protein